MATDRSRKFRSITARIAEIDKQLSSVSKNMQTVKDGLGEDAVSETSIQTGSISANALQVESITADKIAPSVFENASSGIQRVPAPLTSVDYWNSAIYGNITAFTEAYFADKENKNVEATENGILFSPESNSSVIISKAEMLENGLIVLTTETAHGYEIYDYINVQNLGSPFDGEWVITNVPTTTTIVYTVNQFVEESTDIGEDSGAYLVVGGTFGTDSETETASYKHSIIRKSFIDGVVTLTLFDDTDTSANYQTHGYKVGYTISVSGLGSPYDGVHRISYVPDSENVIIQYRVDAKTIAEFEPKISVVSAFGDGEKITYVCSSLHEISVNQVIKITGFTTTTGYNLTGRVSGVYGSGSTFTVDSTVVPATNTPETGGTYECKTAVVTADADSVLFLTGKNPVPTSRNVLVSWASDKPVKVYAVVWVSNLPDNKFFIEIDSLSNPNVYDLTGINNYLWEIPENITHYAIYAEVLAGGEETLLTNFYVFEAVGNADKKIYKVVGASVEPIANDKNKITIYTNSTHPYSAGDFVTLSNMETVSGSLNDIKFEVVSVSENKTNFIVEAPTYKISVDSTNQSYLVNTNPTQNISEKIFVGQPFTSSNTTALPNGSVTALVPTITTTNTKTSLEATLTAGSNAVTLTTGNTEGMFVGQSLLKTSGAGAFVTAGSSYVANISSTTEFTTTANHATSGAIVFAAATTSTSYNSFRVSGVSGGTNTVDLTFYVPTTIVDDQTGLVATLTAGSNTVTLTTGNTDAIYVGQFLTKTSGSGAFGNSGLVYVTSVNASSTTEFTVDYEHATSGSTTFKVSSVGKIALDASVIGGNKQGQITTISSNGLTQKTAEGGQSINLTDDKNVDNHLSIKDVNEEVVASVSSAGAGTFKTLDADSLTIDNDITVAANTALIGDFIDSKYNGKSYGGSLLNRLARGTIYQSAWLTPTTNIPADTRHYGLAAGTFKLDANRLYQVFVSSSGMRANPGAACAFEILLSTTPMAVDDNTGLAHMAYVLPTFASSNVSLGYWRDLQGHFYSISPTPQSVNTTSFTINAWQRYANGNALITVDNADAGKYIQSTIDANSHMFIGVNISSTTYGPYINGTYEVTKQSNTTYLIDTTNTTAVSQQTGTNLGTITLVDPIMTNTKATFNRTSVVATSDGLYHTYNLENLFQKDQLVDVTSANNSWTVSGIIVSATANSFIITPQTAYGDNATAKTGLVATLSTSNNQVLLTTGNTTGLLTGQYLYKTSTGGGAFGNSGNVYITSITNSTHFVVSTNHGTAGSITFTASGVLPNTSTNTAETTAVWSDRQVQLHKNYLPSGTDIYYIIRLRHGSSTFTEYSINVSENPNGLMAVTDLGQAKDVTFVAQKYANGTAWTSGLPIGYNNVTTTTTFTTVTVVDTLSVLDTAYYDNYGKGTGTSIPYAYQYYLYQGNPGTASGIKKSAILFPAINYVSTNGLSITKLEVYLRNRHSYKSTGLTVYLGAHSATSLGSTVPLALNSCVANTATFTKGQGKWITLPTSWHSTFTSGGAGRGILIGVTDENPDTYYNGLDNYGYFDGLNQTDPPQLRITYTYQSNVGANNDSGGNGGGGGYIPI